MAISLLHVRHQIPVIRALGGVALSALSRRPVGGPPPTPGPWQEVELPPRPAELVRDYIRASGGDPGWYRGCLPAHMFPQWGFPLAARALLAAPYPLEKVLNAGCRLEVRRSLPAGEPLRVRARLASIDANEHRALMTQEVITGTASAPDALRAEMRVFVPLGRKGKGEERARPAVPASARELWFGRIQERAGLDFALVTGDFNPIHWVAPYARAAGFKACILHGFATMARAIEGLNRGIFAGDPGRLRGVDVRFVRPLVLPARVGVYADHDGGLWVGDAPGGGVYLEGRYEARNGDN